MEFLTIIFLIAGEPTLLPNFDPIAFPSEEKCEIAKPRAIASVAQHNLPDLYLIDCVKGKEEFDALKERLKNGEHLNGVDA